MPLLFIFSLLIAAWWQESLVIKGRVTEKNTKEGMPGVHISILGQPITTYSDVEGDFVLKVVKPDIPFTIVLKCTSMPSLQLTNVMAQGKDTLDIGRIEMILNRMIPALAFNQWGNQANLKVQPIYRNSTLLGYLLPNEIDENDLRSNCLDQNGKPYYYQYDRVTNSIQVDYTSIKDCL